MRRKLPIAVWVIDTSLGGYAPKKPPKPGILVDRRWVPRGDAGWWEGLVLIFTSGLHEGSWTEDAKWVPARSLVIAEPPQMPA